MSSNMVAEQTSANPLDGAARYTLSTTPLLATCAIAGDAHRFPIPKWAPRQGRNKAFTVWHSAIRQLFAAFGLTLDQLDEEPPALSLQHTALHGTRSVYCDGAG